ncbi:MAG: hypothetical protein QXX85_04725 [Candidatus Nitrosotenuis sp.]
MRIGLFFALIFLGMILTVSSTNLAMADLIVLGNGHAPIYVSDKDADDFDFNNDGLIDYYVKAHYRGNSNQVYKVDYKMIDECVDGDTHEDAMLKLGFSTDEPLFFKRTWFTDFDAWTPWFKAGSNDDNKRIDLVSLPHGALPIPFPSSGDDVIQNNGKNGSFTHKNNITELDGQAGWEGSIFFRGPPGRYFMWTIHPATGISGCDTLAAFGIPIIIN